MIDNEVLKSINKPFPTKYNLSKELEKLDISLEIKKRLSNIKAKIALPKGYDKLKNRINIYIASADYIDGLKRICYMKIEEDCIEICEYKGARGDRYSGFYYILIDMLREKKLIDQRDKGCSLPINMLEDIVDCFNQISDGYEKGLYCLKKTEATYPRVYESKTFNLTISYYCKRGKEITGKIKDTGDKGMIDFLNEKYKICMEGTGDQFLENYGELINIKMYLDEIIDICEKRKEMLERFRERKF